MRLIIPLIVEQVLNATIGIADTLMVAQVGEVAVSGVSLVDSINILLINVFAALATGGAIVSSQYLGREEDENANTAAKQLLLVTTILAGVIMGVCLIGRPWILNALFGSAEKAVMENANTYFWLSALSYPFISLYNAEAALFRAMGNSRISMAASFVMNVTNISFNAIFIYGFKMGVAGAALGSLIARAAGAGMLMIMLRRSTGRIRLHTLLPLKLHPKMVKNILGIGVPTGIENGIFHIGKIMVQGLITSFGTASIAANAVANSLSAFAQMPGSAIGLSMITVIGQCVGAGDYKQARKYILKLTGAAYAMMAALNILFIIFLHPIVGFYGLSAETDRLAYEICFYCCVCMIFIWPSSFTLPNGLRAASDVKFTMGISIFSMWVFRIGFSYLLGSYFQMGVLGTWVAMTIDWVFRMLAFWWRFFSGRWMNKRSIE